MKTQKEIEQEIEIEKDNVCNYCKGKPIEEMSSFCNTNLKVLQTLLNYNQEVIKMIEGHILTDMQGRPLPEVRVLREIIQKLTGDKK